MFEKYKEWLLAQQFLRKMVETQEHQISFLKISFQILRTVITSHSNNNSKIYVFLYLKINLAVAHEMGIRI